MESWLHQHIFKVGWLVTKNLQTTTIFFYTFFLPGVILHEIVYWLAAGMFDVRADRAIGFPEKQEVAELRLNFIKLHKKAPPFKVAVISIFPPIAALVIIYWIAVNVFDFQTAFTLLQPGTLDAFSAAIAHFVSAPDFWLWMYFVLAISNTMIPSNTKVFREFQPIFIVLLVIVVALVLVGLADEIGGSIAPQILNILNSFSALFAVIAILNGAGIVILAIIENTIEYITGDSATFKNGKLIAMRRSEILAQREAERQKARKALQQRKERPALSAGGPPSIYRLPLPLPGAPGDEIVTQTPSAVLPAVQKPLPLPERPRRIEPDVVTTTAAPITASDEPVYEDVDDSPSPDDEIYDDYRENEG
jgi:hypothetical protein